MEIIKEIFTLLGGPSVVLIALFGVLGKIWVTRAIDKNRNNLESEILTMKDQLAVTNKKLDAEIDRSVHIDKKQFDHEFQIYKEVWACLVEVRAATLSLRPTLDYVDLEQSKEDRMKERLGELSLNFNEFVKLVEKNKPFYHESVYEKLSVVLVLVRDESVDYEYTERKQSEYFEEARENQKNIVSAIEEVCESIRGRFTVLKVTS